MFAGRILLATSVPQRADAVIVLSGGDPLGARVRTGAMVLTRLDAPRFVVFLEPSEPQFDPREEIGSFLVDRAGVPSEAISFGGPVESTAEEASRIAGMADACGWSDLVLVTSPAHTRRAGMLARAALPESATVHTVAADEAFDEWLWWASLGHIRTVVSEWLRILADLPEIIGEPPEVAPEVGAVIQC